MKSVLGSALVLFVLACGGSTPAAQNPTTTTAPAPTSASSEAPAAAAPAHSAAGTKPVKVGDRVMDAPAGATVEQSGDGYEVAAPPHFRVFVKPALTTDVSREDLTKPGWGISDLHEEKHEKTIRLYRAKSRNKTSWFVDVLVDVGSDTYECSTKQSIENSEAFTHADVDAMLAACRTLRTGDDGQE